MKLKKIILLIILLNLSTVCATDFHNHDFEGNFQMDIPYKSHFEKTSGFFGLDIGPTKIYQDFENNMNISYLSVINDDTCFNDMIETLKKEPNVNLTKEDELYLITTEKFNIVLLHKDHKIISISAESFEDNKKMANSVQISS